MSELGFPPEARLHTRGDYGRVFGRSQRGYGKHLTVMLGRRGGRGGRRARLGVVVSLKVSRSAVRRHQLKRWARELFRTRLQAELEGQDLVILFKSDPPDKHQAFDDEVLGALARAREAKTVKRRKKNKR